ncbi:MAG: hypothetical protein ACKV2T_10030 [Kofleriaceae bacterium]
MRGHLVTFAAVAACAPVVRPSPPPTVEEAPSPSTKAVAEPFTPPPPRQEPPQRYTGRPYFRERLLQIDGEPTAAVDVVLAQKRSDLWDPCVRDFVQLRTARNPELRDALGDALTSATTTCNRDTRTVTFEPPRSGRAYATGSFVGIAGVLTPTTTELVLRVVTRGNAPERLTILVGGTRWASQTLEVTHDPLWGREIASIPYTKSLARVVRRMLDTDGALLRFESAIGIEDIAITDELAQDLRAMIDVVDEL